MFTVSLECLLIFIPYKDSFHDKLTLNNDILKNRKHWIGVLFWLGTVRQCKHNTLRCHTSNL